MHFRFTGPSGEGLSVMGDNERLEVHPRLVGEEEGEGEESKEEGLMMKVGGMVGENLIIEALEGNPTLLEDSRTIMEGSRTETLGFQ